MDIPRGGAVGNTTAELGRDLAGSQFVVALVRQQPNSASASKSPAPDAARHAGGRERGRGTAPGTDPDRRQNYFGKAKLPKAAYPLPQLTLTELMTCDPSPDSHDGVEPGPRRVSNRR